MLGQLSSRRAFLKGLGSALAAPTLVGAAPFESLSGQAFGTHWRVTGPDRAALSTLQPALAALFAEIDYEMSPWRADSAISRFNASPAGTSASHELIHVAQTALWLARESEGAFDPTVGPLVARWGFGPIAQGGAPDWRGLKVDAGQILKRDSDLTLDLCGIAKGRALDRAIILARNQGIDNLLLDLGGELRALGRHPEGRDWRVVVEGSADDRSVPAILHLPAGMAVATSGLSAQSYGLNGRTWGHIMDPTTARPVEGRLWSVTVLAADAMIADGWATALFAAGDQGGPALARAKHVAALFLFDNGTTLRRVACGGIDEVLT